MKRVVWFTAIILATVTAVVVLWQFRSVLALFVLSLAVAATARPLINRLIRLGVPTGLALMIVYVLGIAGFIFLATAISQSVVTELQRLANEFTLAYEQIEATWPNGSMLQQTIAAQLPLTNELFGQIAGPQGTALVETALGVTLSAVDLISQTLLILVLSLYWSTDQVRFERLWLSLLPAEQRVRARTIWRSVETGVGSYIRSELAQSLLAVLVLSVVYSLIGMQYPVLTALLSAILWLIPLVGGPLVVLTVLVSGLAASPLVAGFAVAITAAVLLVLELRVEPRLFDRRSYNSIVVLLVMIAMLDAFGLLGLIVAPPIAVALQICISELANPVMPIAAGTPSVVAQPASAQVTLQVDQIRDRLSTVRKMLSQMEEPSPRLQSMADRLEGLVRELDPVVEQEQAGVSRSPLA